MRCGSLSLLLITCLFSLAYTYAITGASGAVDTSTGERPARQEFRLFTVSGAAFDLYILALQQLTQEEQNFQLSFFQVSGIHDRPYIPWDGVNGQYEAGYCTHSSILFPSWHRPYLALFEQLLWNNAQNIAATYPSSLRAQYQSAAQSLRIPFYDWALNSTMPDQTNEPMILINTPDGLRNIKNPLYDYTFHPQPNHSDFPESDGQASLCLPQYVEYADGNSQPNISNMMLEANADAIRSGVYNLISSQPDYAPFSNTGFVDDRGNRYDSIENIHNGIHTLIGNGGHMAIVPYSAFDPIFWLHHTNVDRLIAIWQAIYPDSWINSSEVTAGGTFTDAPGSSEDANTGAFLYDSNHDLPLN
ncbi:uncharacterized protein KY384_008601 [Bacidia gigantensis]|uniref:uncharacterized protein n=1 Tax=Bacidia gigantensis TaxID=2732470 RepID=UPI001D03AC6C|nr:uncharacterized protein KY384_008601 [Bacidia gigantensis]KAG8527171.1 hypothetical protein KY384_008601 [Bacidia gigantensis]